MEGMLCWQPRGARRRLERTLRLGPRLQRAPGRQGYPTRDRRYTELGYNEVNAFLDWLRKGRFLYQAFPGAVVLLFTSPRTWPVR